MNSDKLQLRMKEVPFIGHVATGEGHRPDPSKVQAIGEMPPPENVAGIQRILGMSQYLSKFLPRLSDITKPLMLSGSGTSRNRVGLSASSKQFPLRLCFVITI